MATQGGHARCTDRDYSISGLRTEAKLKGYKHHHLNILSNDL